VPLKADIQAAGQTIFCFYYNLKCLTVFITANLIQSRARFFQSKFLFNITPRLILIFYSDLGLNLHNHTKRMKANKSCIKMCAYRKLKIRIKSQEKLREFIYKLRQRGTHLNLNVCKDKNSRNTSVRIHIFFRERITNTRTGEFYIRSEMQLTVTNKSQLRCASKREEWHAGTDLNFYPKSREIIKNKLVAISNEHETQE
jgi:hypothetical protein